MLGSYCLSLNSSFFQSRTLFLEVLAQLAFSRATGKLVEQSRLLLGVPHLSLYWSSILTNLGRCYNHVGSNLLVEVRSKVLTVLRAEPHISDLHRRILLIKSMSGWD